MKLFSDFLRVLPDKIGLTNKSRYEALAAIDEKNNPNPYILSNKILNLFHRGGGLIAPLQVYKLAELQYLVRLYSPKKIIELGSGSSTAILAEYSYNTRCQVLSVDENIDWLNNTKKILKELGYDNHVQIIQNDAILSEDRLVAQYCNLSLSSCDLLIVDGPSLVRNSVNYKNAVCLDAANIDASVILVDMRKATTVFISNLLKFNYKYLPSDVLFGVIPENRSLRYWSVFERISNATPLNK